LPDPTAQHDQTDLNASADPIGQHAQTVPDDPTALVGPNGLRAPTGPHGQIARPPNLNASTGPTARRDRRGLRKGGSRRERRERRSLRLLKKGSGSKRFWPMRGSHLVERPSS
jgi:hypothetical protein